MSKKEKTVFIKATGNSTVVIEDSYTEADELAEKDATSRVSMTRVEHNIPKEARDAS